jgi:hypothetical protein
MVSGVGGIQASHPSEAGQEVRACPLDKGKTLSKKKNWMYGPARIHPKDTHGAKALILNSQSCPAKSILGSFL